MRQRRGPWLSGMILALIGSVWMIGQVFGAVITSGQPSRQYEEVTFASQR